MQTVAELVDHLFRTRLRPDGKEFTYQEVSDTLKGELDPTYLYKVRSGKIQNPGRNALKLLCLFFKVSASYFFPELEDQPPRLDSARNADQQLDVALRSNNLSPESQAIVHALVRALRNKEPQRNS